MRRLKGWLVTGESVATLLRGPQTTVKAVSDAPATAKFVTSYFDSESMCFVVVLEDESFEIVSEGCRIPIGQTATVFGECSLVDCDTTTNDYILHVMRGDGSIVKILVPREDCGDDYYRLCMEHPVVHGLNLVTEGHYT